MNYNPIGIVFLIYGIVKIVLVTSLFLIPPEIENKLSAIEGIDLFVSGDPTLAGEMYEYVLLVFAVFSIIHGLALLGFFSERVHNIIESKNTQYPMYIALGLWLIIFYGLVLYTNLPIEKDPKYMHNYKIYCYLGGLSFLLVPPLWSVVERVFPSLAYMKEDTQLMYMTLIMLAAIFVVFLAYIVTKRLHKLYKDGKLRVPLVKSSKENSV